MIQVKYTSNKSCTKITFREHPAHQPIYWLVRYFVTALAYRVYAPT